MISTKFLIYFRKFKFGLFAILLFLFLAFLSVLSYTKTIKDQKKDKLQQLEVAANITLSDFENIIRNNIGSLEDLRDRIEVSDGDFKQHLNSESLRIIKRHQSIDFVEFIDSTGVIKFIAPLEPNIEALNLDLKKIEYRIDSWIKSSLDTTTNITNWVELTQQGKAFLVDVPMYYGNGFQGTITAGVNFRKQFDNISFKQNLFSVQVRDDAGKLFYSYNQPKPEAFKKDEIVTLNLYPIAGVKNVAWQFIFMFNNENEFRATASQNYLLAIAMFLSLLISLLAYFFLLARQRSAQYLATNQRLSEVNEELKIARNRAERASIAKTQFLSHMSHEIRTPLSAILSISEILEGKRLSEGEREFLKLMQNSSRTLLNLVNNVLNIDKIESGRLELAQQAFKPLSALKKIVAIYSQAATVKGLEVNTNFEEFPNSKSVIGDISRTEQIFTNLVSNAVKFTDKGSVTINYHEIEIGDELQIKVSVIDTGIGINPSQLDVIFERFKQLDFGITKKHQGSGLGLAITKMMVVLMQGTIHVESEIGKGSTFTVTLKFPKIDLKEKKKIDRKYRNLSHLSVLIVDDNILNRMILGKILSKKKIDPDFAVDGDEAILKCATKNYDLIFMDVHMPGKDGFEIVKYLRNIRNKAVILGFSADATKEAVEHGKSVGMNEYLTKPIEQETLFTILGKYFL
ncbi:MAG: hypothetical protein CL526_08850 [Aequorivita sp.]|nr:hypothetical protein [Aequorivita sp.]|tara:strand:- start:78257 stop:80314 length:2058 start_codon:yes stop_codon:yes gene_type:complete